jgi:hypothetical protein
METPNPQDWQRSDSDNTNAFPNVRIKRKEPILCFETGCLEPFGNGQPELDGCAGWDVYFGCFAGILFNPFIIEDVWILT